MTDDGEYQSISVETKSSMPTHEFYEKYFHSNVHGVYQWDKRITYEWDKSLTVFQNEKSKGVLFFFERPLGHAVEVRFEISSPGKTEA